jgi:hypothetical protein
LGNAAEEPVIRAAVPSLVLASCGFVDNVGRTEFQVPELAFGVNVSAGDPLEPAVPLEQPVDLNATPALGGAASLSDVRIEQAEIAVYKNSLGVPIRQALFLVSADAATQAVFAVVSDVPENTTRWPPPELNEQGTRQLETFIADLHAPFYVGFRFDVTDAEVASSDGALDIRLRIHASALARQ